MLRAAFSKGEVDFMDATSLSVSSMFSQKAKSLNNRFPADMMKDGEMAYLQKAKEEAGTVISVLYDPID